MTKGQYIDFYPCVNKKMSSRIQMKVIKKRFTDEQNKQN